MKGVKSFIISFYERKGALILFSSIFFKLMSFLISYSVIRLIDKEEFGFIAYASTIISFMIPFMGMGAFQSLLRFGASANSLLLKRQVFNYTLSRGVILSIFLALIIAIFSPWITISLPNSGIYLSILCFQLVSLFILESIKSYVRLLHLNQLYAYLEIINGTVLLLVSVGLCLLFGGKGYVIGLAVGPFVVAIGALIKLRIGKFNIPKLPKGYRFNEFWKYGLFVSLGAVASQLLYSIDIISIGNIIKDAEKVAMYKAASLIPFSLMFVPLAFMTTDFVQLAERSQDRKFLRQYLKNYLLLFVIISIGMLIVFIPFADYIVSMFGDQYEDTAYLFRVFSIGLVGAFILRIPCGNLLSAVGKANWNAFVSAIILMLNIVLNYFFVIHYGAEGAAYVTVGLMWLSGITTFILFLIYLKRLPGQ